jgi:enoyl-CoA hydratase/carnithine racemase
MTSVALDPSEAPLLRVDADGVVTLTLNRPWAGNSLSRDLIVALAAELAAIAADRSVRVVVLAAEGAVFCAGHDLSEFAAFGGDARFGKEIGAACSVMMQAITDLPQPVIAKVQGVATAAGLQLVAAADLAVAASTARFATPGVNIGLWCLTPQVPLSRAVARKHALELLLTGDLYDAEHAFRIGLVNRVVPPENLDAAVTDLARRIAGRSGHAVALGKRSFHRQAELTQRDAYEYTGEVLVRALQAEDAAEGIAAFVGKRPPVWSHR